MNLLSKPFMFSIQQATTGNNRQKQATTGNNMNNNNNELVKQVQPMQGGRVNCPIGVCCSPDGSIAVVKETCQVKLFNTCGRFLSKFMRVAILISNFPLSSFICFLLVLGQLIYHETRLSI